ncbi:MAG: PAS domain-containing protein [Archangiaceae bacterium]|nr:PAS domain-containing protein [Archangiaceae bacterium]
MQTPRFTSVLAAIVAALALVGLSGWWFDVAALRNFGAASTMKPNTALSLLLLAGGLVALVRGRRLGAIGLALAPLVFGAGAVLGTWLGWGDGLDALWWHSGSPQRMSVGTGLGLSCLSLGVMLAAAMPTRLALSQVFATSALSISLVALVGYTLGLQSLGASSMWSTMALHTAIGLALSSVALLGATKAGPVTRTLLGEGLAATLGRRLALFVVVVPWLAALLLIHLGGPRVQDLALDISQVMVPAEALLLAAVLRFTSTVSRTELDLGITLDSIGDAVMLTDARGDVLRLNPVAERLTGWSSAEAKGQPVERVFHIIAESTRARVESPVLRVLREGVVVGLANHTLLIDRAGNERPIADSGAPVRGSDGSMRGVVLVFRDMTEEYAAQRQVQRAAATLKSVMNAMPMGVMATREGRLAWLNPAGAGILGGDTPEALVGRSVLDFIPPEDAALASARLEALASGAPLPPRRARIRNPSGEVLIDALPVPGTVDIDGVPAHLSLLQRVSDSDALQLRLARQTSFLRATAELSQCLSEASFDLKRILEDTARLAAPAPDEFAIVFLLTADTPRRIKSRAAWASRPELKAFVQRFEVPLTAGPLGQRVLAGEVVTVPGAALRAGLTPEAVALLGDQKLSYALLQPLRSHAVTYGMLAIARTAERPFDDDEKRFYADLADRSGQALRNAQLFDEVNVTLETLKQTEAQLRHSQKLDALGQLAGGVAHDFNNLLTVILSVVELMLHGRPVDDADRSDLEDVRDAATRAAGLTRQLLAFSRKQVMQLRAVDVNEVVRGMEGLLKPLLGEPVMLTFSLEPSLPPVKADPTLVTQVVMNLCVNARDAMPRGGKLTVSSSLRTPDFPSRPAELPPGDYVCVRVDDEGEGMTPEVQARIFEPFFTTKGPGKGTGLGLSTSYGIARQTGGTMTVRSMPGRGTTFEVWLPVYRGGPRVATPPPVTAPRSGSGVVLLVEDDASVREVAQRLLVAAGYQVHPADGVISATALAAKLGRVDLLLTDVVMPDGSGRELADALLERMAGLKVLFMSGYTDDEVMRRGVRDGQVRLLQKPFTPTTLLDAVATTLR